MKAAFETVALVGKYKSPEIAEPLLRLGSYLEKRGIRVVVDQLTAGNVSGSHYSALSLDDIGVAADLAVVLGGDGTMLNIARTLAPYDVSLVGVNLGRLGFLTDISTDRMLETIGDILDGNHVAEERMLLSASVERAGAEIYEGLALNDVVVHRGAMGSMIEFEVRIDGEYVYTQRSDGLILASPTGSTAYALSAGGPILHPTLSSIVLVPVSSHTLSNRPIVVGGESVVEIQMGSRADCHVHFDSHAHVDLEDGDRVLVRRYKKKIRFLHPPGHNYYHMLREKLHWSEAL